MDKVTERVLTLDSGGGTISTSRRLSGVFPPKNEGWFMYYIRREVWHKEEGESCGPYPSRSSYDLFKEKVRLLFSLVGEKMQEHAFV